MFEFQHAALKAAANYLTFMDLSNLAVLKKTDLQVAAIFGASVSGRTQTPAFPGAPGLSANSTNFAQRFYVITVT